MAAQPADVIETYKKLKRNVDNLKPREKNAEMIVDAARFLLENYPLESENDLNEQRDVNEMKEELMNMVPAANILFTDVFLSQPMFPLILLKKVVDLYGFAQIDGAWLTQAQLANEVFGDSRTAAIVWLCAVTKASPCFSKSVLSRFNNIISEKNEHSPIQKADPRSETGNDAPLSGEPGPSGSPIDVKKDGNLTRVDIPRLPNSVSRNEYGTSSNSHESNRNDRSDQGKKMSCISQSFKGNKFSGNVEESIEQTLQMYEIYSQQIELSPQQMSDFFIHALSKPALTFFLNSGGKGKSYDEIKQMMLNEYNSDSRQAQTKRRLDMLRLRNVMIELGITDLSAGLAATIQRVENWTTQCHQDYRSDRHMVDFLSQAVAEYAFSIIPTQNIDSLNLNFRSYSTALHASIQTQARIDQMSAERTGVAASSNSDVATLIAQYAKNPRYVKHKHSKKPTKNRRGQGIMTFEEARKLGLCQWCGDKWAKNHICKAEAIKEKTRQRLKNGESAVHIISDIIKEREHYEATTSDTDSESDSEHNVKETGFLENEVKEFDSYHNHESVHSPPAQEEMDEELADLISQHLMVTPSEVIETGYIVENEKNPTQIFNMECATTLINDSKVSSRPLGFCADIGAPRSVVGMKELHHIFAETHLTSRQRKSNHSFRFGNSVHQSLGIITLPLKTPDMMKDILVDLDIVSADIPALLGLDAMDRESLTPCTVSNTLIKKAKLMGNDGKPRFKELWSVPLQRAKSGHLYAQIASPIETDFTKKELQKFHMQYFHPSPTKLYNLLKRVRPEDVNADTLEALNEITEHCDPCQRIKRAPLRFRVSFGAEHVRFNERILVDMMFIDGAPVLHIIDEGTKFSAARFLPNQQTGTIWKTILECWAVIYTGLPHRILTDQGSNFGDAFVEIGRAHNVEVQRTGVEAHSSLGLGERYHGPLRNTYRKLRISYPNADKALTLAMAVKAMNDTLGPEGIVPSALVFGEYPQVFTESEDPLPRATLDERAKMAEEARAEMEEIMAKMRAARALKHATPPAANVTYEPQDIVLVWRENVVAGRIGEWVGPFEVASFDPEKKLVHIRDPKKPRTKPFNVAQVKKYKDPKQFVDEEITHICETLGKAFGHNLNDSKETHATEVIDKDDPRASTEEMREAIRAEVQGLIDRGTFEVLKKKDVPKDANIVPLRFVLALKSGLTIKPKNKARAVLGGHLDKLKELMVHITQTIQPSSIRLLSAIAEMFGWELWLSDVCQSYLQANKPLGRLLYVLNVPKEFGLADDECFLVKKPLYGLTESGDLWHATVDGHHRDDLVMKPLRSDAATFTKLDDSGELIGLSGLYVDDLLRTGTPEFRKLCRMTNDKFDMAEDENVPFEFVGATFEREEDGTLIINQHRYLKRLEELQPDADFSQFRSMRMRLAWLANTRPDCLHEIAQLAQVSSEVFEAEKKQCIKRLNRAVKYAINNRTPLRIKKLDPESVRIVGFSDASFAGNRDLSSQLGYIILLVDKHNNCVPLMFKSYKARRVTRSAMAAEVIAFSDMADAAVTLSKEVERTLGRTIALQLLTDSKCLFDVISKGSRTSERRLMLDIASSRESFRVGDISDIGLVRSADNIADGLTKTMSQAALHGILSTGRVNITLAQSIIRDDINSSPKQNTRNTASRDIQTNFTKAVHINSTTIDDHVDDHIDVHQQRLEGHQHHLEQVDFEPATSQRGSKSSHDHAVNRSDGGPFMEKNAESKIGNVEGDDARDGHDGVSVGSAISFQVDGDADAGRVLHVDDFNTCDTIVYRVGIPHILAGVPKRGTNPGSGPKLCFGPLDGDQPQQIAATRNRTPNRKSRRQASSSLSHRRGSV